jgi:hypothetical protein
MAPSEVAAVIARHARHRADRPLRCRPSAEERRERAQGVVPRVRRERPGSDWKYIYDTAAAAEAAAAEFAAAGERMRPYPCARSRTGHYHLTADHSGTAAPAAASNDHRPIFDHRKGTP